jgi:transposase
MMLSDEQWKQVEGLFPTPKRRRDWGWLTVGVESPLSGKYSLGSACGCRNLPDEYPDASTCWRRLRMWEEQGIWLRAWQALLARMDERKRLQRVIAEKGYDSDRLR